VIVFSAKELQSQQNGISIGYGFKWLLAKTWMGLQFPNGTTCSYFTLSDICRPSHMRGEFALIANSCLW